MLTALRKDCFRVIHYGEIIFDDSWNRVAQLLHVELTGPFSQGTFTSQGLLIVNTHLLFPHDLSLSLIRLQQVKKLHTSHLSFQLIIYFTRFVPCRRRIKSFNVYRFTRKKTSSIQCQSCYVGKFWIFVMFPDKIHLKISTLLCSDWNGSKRGYLYKFLRSQGFESSYDTAHRYTDADSQKVIFDYTYMWAVLKKNLSSKNPPKIVTIYLIIILFL